LFTIQDFGEQRASKFPDICFTAGKESVKMTKGKLSQARNKTVIFCVMSNKIVLYSLGYSGKKNKFAQIIKLGFTCC